MTLNGYVSFRIIILAILLAALVVAFFIWSGVKQNSAEIIPALFNG